MIRLISAIALTLVAASAAFAQSGDVTVITGGRVVTGADAGIIDPGVVVIRGDRIASVESAEDFEAPEGARVIDASGQWVTAGLFSPFTRLGLVEVASEDDADDRAAATAPFSAALDVANSFNPRSPLIPSTRVEGVTRVAIAPSPGASIFAGRGALADTSGGFDSLFEERAFMFAALDQSGAALAGGSRAAAWAFLDAALGDARAYPARFTAQRDGDAINRYDAEALVAVVRQGMPLMIEVDRAADILAALRFQRDNPGLRLILVGAAEGGSVAEAIAAANVPVLVDPLRNLPASFDVVGADFANVLALEEAGVLYAITPLSASSGDTFNVRLIPQHAGNAVARGLEWDAAFEAISLSPARIFGVDDRFGSLESGKVADVVIWDGDPLEVMSAPTAVFIDGAETSLETRQTALRDRYLPREGVNDAPPAWRQR